ncbi:efflux transporter outer membrane subunit [Piscinibacter koreensis]|uniref:Efflux transporter outer membrane subunit n=1 Tax=Piscinibacter koreensis TaxID=2742824 RepID=A0A7Y6NPT9_9BURK|nr:efflux transporter outer membrane subunit [Schlegelella koreensis]NUZ07076.1 efflux transporter outer membrane subunit [Schlegelella koreensis]
MTDPNRVVATHPENTVNINDKIRRWTPPPTVTALVVAIASSVVLTLGGCASTGGIAPKAQAIEPAQVGVTGAPLAAPLAADWWREFDDPQLSSLIERALAGSPNLRVAEARIARAAAGVAGAEAAEGPQGQITADATRQRFTANGMIPPPVAGSMMTTANAQLAGSWELDFFGRHRAALEAALGSQRAAEADAQAARNLLATNVARSYVQLARMLEQREVLARSIGQREQTLGLIRQRVQAGLDTVVELRVGEGAIPETRQQAEAVEEQITLARNALAALTLQPPKALAGLTPRLAGLHARPLPTEVPADLLGQRADIAAARWRVEASTREVAAARAQFYPNVNLTAFVGLSSLGLDRLVRSGSEQYGAGPAIRLPIFDGRRLRANLAGRAADVDAAIESYNGAIVDAVREVADQIGSLRAIERQQREQAAAAAAAEAAYAAATQRFRAGLTTYLTVLNAETNVLNQRRQGADLDARALDAQVLLIRALGGGFRAPAPATARADRAAPATASATPNTTLAGVSR